ncbi:MAG: oxidoreductase [candidate division Zixibacteria bacterium HGW-Zixibacteria-1]|nr:MAG: oxidoreductase [candidate division Zixibacteria bacterium HGW-Zixibacteria-1]
MSKPKVAFYWCASCGGCEEAVVDLAEDILQVVGAVDIVFWPVALDFKKSDVEAMADGEIVVSFINGAVRSSEQHEMVELLRRKSQIVIAFGSCAHLGGIPGLANTFNRQEMIEEVYFNAPSVVNDEKMVPKLAYDTGNGILTLPLLWDTVKSLDQVIKVEYYLPGCPPPVKLIKEAVGAILSGQLPAPGAVLAPDISLCEECERRDTKPEKMALKSFKRPFEIEIDQEKCLLAQGLLCLGPVTRQGCGSACPKGNMPCTGCMGPTSRVIDFGAKALSAFASMADSNDDREIIEILSQIVDPVGTFHRYSLPASMMHRRYQPSVPGENSHE